MMSFGLIFLKGHVRCAGRRRSVRGVSRGKESCYLVLVFVTVGISWVDVRDW